MNRPAAKIISRTVATPDIDRLVARLALEPLPALLDSAGGPSHLCRWTVAAFNPFRLLCHRDGRSTVVRASQATATAHAPAPTTPAAPAPPPSVSQSAAGGEATDAGNHPLRALRGMLREYHLDPAAQAGAGLGHLPAVSAAIGFLGYEVGRYVERLPGLARRDTSLPDMHWGFYDHLLVIDHHRHQATIVATDIGGRNPRQLLDQWQQLMADLDTGKSASADEARGPSNAENIAPATTALDQLESTFTRDAYCRAVARTIDYIDAGDIFQANLSQRFSAPLSGRRPVDLYRRLRRTNPAPYAAFIAAENWAVLSSSPELFLDLNQGHVITRPIKGTRPRRPSDEQFNQRMLQQLVASTKDDAELVMIVDLQRNDLGRVCDYGTVRVTQPRVIEAYASVFHSVAQVEGQLNSRFDLVDLLRASFPGGSITGAPKVRAMQIIDELEPVARSVYTGAIGCIGLQGSLCLNIAIRTLIVDNDRVHLQVGGGIVADSDPAAEYDETLAKARSMLEALGVALPAF